MYEELLKLWKTKRRILAKWDDPRLAGVVYQLDKCIFDLEGEMYDIDPRTDFGGPAGSVV